MSIDRWAGRIAAVALTLTFLVGTSVGGAAAAPARPLVTDHTARAQDVIPPFLPSPTTLAFPGRSVGTISSPRAVTFWNSTEDPQAVATLAIAGSASGDYAIASETCTTAPIPTGGNCTVELTVTPSALGARTATLELSDSTPAIVGSVPLEGTGQVVSNLGWSTIRTAGPSRTGSYGSELARTTSSTAAYLHTVYTTDRVGGAFVTDHGPYLGVYYTRSSSPSGTTWSTPVRINPSTKHGDDGTIATSGSYVYVAWVSQTKVVNFSASAPRALYIRVNSNHGKGTWRSAIRLSSATGRVYDAHVAAAGAHVYVSVTDSNSGAIRLYISDNRGRTWRSTTLGTTSSIASIGKQGGATVAANGSTVVVAWAANADHMIKTRRSTNSGSTWAAAATLANRSVGLPEVAVLGGRAVVGWPTDDGVDLRMRTSAGWGPLRHVTAPDTGKPYSINHSAALALNGTSRIGVAWSGCWSSCDTDAFKTDVLWSETADNGASWYGSQVVAAASSTTTNHANDAAAIVWPSTGRRTIIWNGYTPNTSSYRLYTRTSSGAP